MIKILKIAFLTTLSINSMAVGAPANSKTQEQNTTISDDATYQKVVDDFQKVIDEFRSYILTVSLETKQEIKDFRQKIKDLNKLKFDAYKELSQEAQGFLKKERDLKNKLPIQTRRELMKELKEGDKAKQEAANSPASTGKQEKSTQSTDSVIKNAPAAK